MGQATVDLPDPLQSPPVNAANTDDLLAQLAGEEIDRLLAEADTGAPPVTPPPAPTVNSPNEPATPAVVAAPAPATQAAGSDDKASLSSAELNDLLGQLDVTAPPPPPKTAVPPSASDVPVPPAAPAPATLEEHPVAAEMDEDARMSAGVGLGAPVIAQAKAERVDVVPAKAVREPGLPVILRPLEWLNAPLASCPDHIRDTIGKIAILTTVNAISVLAYVLLFRGH